MHIGSGKSHPCGKFWECRKRWPYAGWIGAWAFPDQKRNVISIHSTFWCANKNPASEATRLQWNIRKVCELFQTLASGTAVSSSGMSSASKTGCSSSRSSSFNVWPAQVSQSKPSLEKTWGTLMHRITCFYLCALEAFADTVPSLRVTKGGQKSARQISAQFLSSSSWPLPAPLLLLGHQAYPLWRIWSQGVGKHRTNYPIGSNHRDKNARPNIYCQVLWWYESPWMQSCLNVFVAPDRQSPWACDLKQGSIFTKSKGGFHPNMANWPILQLLQPLDKIEPWQNRSTRQSVGGPRPRVASPCPPMVLSVYINESSDKVDCYRAFAMSSITSTIWSARFKCLLQGISQCIWFIADCRWYVQGVHNFEAANHWFLHVFAIQLDMLWSPKRASFLMWQR